MSVEVENEAALPLQGKVLEAEVDKQEGASEEQKRYAAVLDIAMKAGLAVLVVTFVLYLVGFPQPHIPVGDVSQFWGMKVDKYLEAVGVEHGWSWVARMGEGDFLNFAPIAFLAAITTICYLTIIPVFLKRKDTVYALLAAAEILVLVLAASGVLPSGGH